jgi:hypothetical protein
MSDLPLAISNIPHDATLAYHTAESTTMRTKVPSNVEKYARINRIGGMTYKCNNLIPFPYADKSKTAEGITFTVNEDRSVTVSGTATADANFYFVRRNVSILTGKPVTISVASGSNGTVAINARKLDINGSSKAFIESTPNKQTAQLAEGESLYTISIYIASGTTVNATVYPMLNYGDTALPYEPYFDGLRNASVTALESHGVNLLNVKQMLNDVFVDNGDGTYTLTKTSTNGRFSANADFKMPKGTQLTFKCDIVDGSADVTFISFRILDADKTTLAASGQCAGNARGVKLKCDSAYIQLYLLPEHSIGAYITVKNLQINYGYLTEYPYKPYIGEIDKVEIPEAVRSLPDYGCGVKNYPNTIEWREDGRCYYVQRTTRYIVNGTETWYRESSSIADFWRYYFYVSKRTFLTPSNELSPTICNHYETVKGEDAWSGTEGVITNTLTSGSTRVYLYTAKFADVDSLKAHLAELYAAGNPLIVDYALAEPIETDITDLMRDNFIAVEGNGTITAVNEHGYDAETSITYLINTVGG